MLQHISDNKESIIRELFTVLGQNYSNGSVVSVDMDVDGVMAEYLPVVRVCSTLSRECLSRQKYSRFGGIRTHYLSNQATADRCLREHDCCDWSRVS